MDAFLKFGLITLMVLSGIQLVLCLFIFVMWIVMGEVTELEKRKSNAER